MLNTFFSIYQGFFSRGFWLGCFLPVALFTAVHLTLAAVQFPAQVPLVDWLTSSADAPAKLIPILLAVLVVLAWMLAPLVPMLRSLLDGALLPDWLLEALRQERVDEATQAADAEGDVMTALEDAYDRWQDFAKDAQKTFVAARKDGKDRTPPDERLTNQAVVAISDFRAATAGGRVPPVKLAQQAVDALAAALRAGTADSAIWARLDGLGRVLIAAIVQTREQTKLRLDSAAERRADNPLHHYRATRIGDVREQTQSYPSRVYGVDFEFLWPRLQVFFAKDDPLAQRLDDAQSQVDFGVLALALAVTVPLVWLPLLAATAREPWLFLVVGVVSPLVIKFFNELVIQSQRGFGTIVETAIDRYRLDVLTRLLLQPMPATRSAERTLWAAVRIANDTWDTNRLSYVGSPG
jgi:hypothetical protein